MSRHEGVNCDACFKSNFRIRRYKCLICYDYDLCGPCFDKKCESKNHKNTHPMQCILTRNDYPTFFGDEEVSSNCPSSYTCPQCGDVGYSQQSLLEHVSKECKKKMFGNKVICPLCAGTYQSHQPNRQTTDLANHLVTEHKNILASSVPSRQTENSNSSATQPGVVEVIPITPSTAPSGWDRPSGDGPSRVTRPSDPNSPSSAAPSSSNSNAVRSSVILRSYGRGRDLFSFKPPPTLPQSRSSTNGAASGPSPGAPASSVSAVSPLERRLAMRMHGSAAPSSRTDAAPQLVMRRQRTSAATSASTPATTAAPSTSRERQQQSISHQVAELERQILSTRERLAAIESEAMRASNVLSNATPPTQPPTSAAPEQQAQHQRNNTHARSQRLQQLLEQQLQNPGSSSSEQSETANSMMHQYEMMMQQLLLEDEDNAYQETENQDGAAIQVDMESGLTPIDSQPDDDDFGGEDEDEYDDDIYDDMEIPAEMDIMNILEAAAAAEGHLDSQDVAHAVGGATSEQLRVLALSGALPSSMEGIPWEILTAEETGGALSRLLRRDPAAAMLLRHVMQHQTSGDSHQPSLRWSRHAQGRSAPTEETQTSVTPSSSVSEKNLVSHVLATANATESAEFPAGFQTVMSTFVEKFHAHLTRSTTSAGTPVVREPAPENVFVDIFPQWYEGPPEPSAATEGKPTSTIDTATADLVLNLLFNKPD